MEHLFFDPSSDSEQDQSARSTWCLAANKTVAEVLAIKLPAADASLRIVITKDDPVMLGKMAPPPRPTVSSRREFRQLNLLHGAVADGYRSLAVGDDRLPLDYERVWAELDVVERIQARFRRSLAWLDKLKGNAREVLTDALWTAVWDARKASEEGPSLESLVSFLSDDWLGEFVVNYAIANIIQLGRSNPELPSRRYELIPSDCLTIAIHSSATGTTLDKYCFEAWLVRISGWPCATLGAIHRHIIKHPEAIWFLPICDGSHWFLARLDVANNQWELYNSMASRALDERVLAALGDLFRLLGLKLDANKPITPSTPQQLDSSSCGPAVINIVENELLDYTAAFDPGRPKNSRVRQFQRLLGDFHSRPRNLMDTSSVDKTANTATSPTGVADGGPVEGEPLPSETGRPPAKPRAGASRFTATPQLRDLPPTATQRHRSASSNPMRTRKASSVRRDDGGAPPISSASRTPRTVTALSDITNNLVDTKPDLSAGKERVPAKAHQRARSNKGKPSKDAAATASLAKPIEPVKPGKSKSSGVVAVAKDDNSLDASIVSGEADHRFDALTTTTTSDKEDEVDNSEEDNCEEDNSEEDHSEGENSLLGPDASGAEKESDYLQKPSKMSTSKRQRTAELDDQLLPTPRQRPERRTKVPRISVQALHFPDLSDEDSMIGGAAEDNPHTNMRASLSSPQQVRPCKPNDAASSILAGMGISASPHMLCCAQALLEDAELRSRPGLLRLCLLQMRGQHELQRVVETLGEEIKALRSTLTKQSVDDLKRKVAPLAKIFVATPFLLTQLKGAPLFALARPQEALLRFGTVQRDYWNANPDFHSSALSIYANVLSTARSDLHKLIRRTHLDEIDIVQALQIWYKDHPLAYTDEHVVWWSVLCVVKRHEGGKKEREYWQVHSTVMNDLATKAARHHGSKRLYYPDSQYPKMMQANVSTTDSSFQAVCTSVLGTYQPSADFRHLVLDRVREMAEGTLKGQDGLKHGEDAFHGI